jgi:hypothetical protein
VGGFPIGSDPLGVGEVSAELLDRGFTAENAESAEISSAVSISAQRPYPEIRRFRTPADKVTVTGRYGFMMDRLPVAQ